MWLRKLNALYKIIVWMKSNAFEFENCQNMYNSPWTWILFVYQGVWSYKDAKNKIKKLKMIMKIFYIYTKSVKDPRLIG